MVSTNCGGEGQIEELSDWRAAALCVFVVAIAFLGSIASIRYVTLDDRWYAAWVWNGSWLQSAIDTAAQHGRLLKPSSFTMFFPYLLDARLWPLALRLGSIVLAAFLASMLLRKFLRSTPVALLYALLFFALAQNSSDSNLFVAYPFAWEFSWISWMLGLYALALAIERGSTAIATCGAIIWLIGLQEGFVPHTILFFLVPLVSSNRAGRRWTYLGPYMVGILGWGIAWILWRVGHPSNYAGSQIAVIGSISDMIRTWAYFSLGGMPMATIFNGRSSMSVQTIVGSVNALSLIKMTAVFLGVLWLSAAISKSHIAARTRPVLIMAVFLLSLAFLPNLVLALTPKYQEWMKFGVRAYLYSHFSYFAWVGLGTLLLFFICNRWKSRILAIGLASLASMASLITDASNRIVNQEQEMFGLRWNSMITLMASEAFAAIPEGSRIYFSDSSVTGTESGDATYWNYVFKARTGKNVYLSPDIDTFRNSGGSAYFLYLYDEPRSANRYVILAPLEPDQRSPQMTSKHLFVYPDSENERVQVGGAIQCGRAPCLASVAANSRPAAGLFDTVFSIAAKYRSDANGVPVVEVESSEAVDLSSVWADFARSLRKPSMPVEIAATKNFLGWQESVGTEINWGGTDATLAIKNTTMQSVTLDVEIWLVAGDSRSVFIEDDGGRRLAEVRLEPAIPGFAQFSVQAKRGVSEIRLHTDKPALYDKGPKGMAYQLRNLGIRRDSQISTYDFE